MVNFTDITYNKDFIYAHVEVYREQADVTIPRDDDKRCIIKGNVSEDAEYYIRRAVANLKYELMYKGKLNKSKSIAWG